MPHAGQFPWFFWGLFPLFLVGLPFALAFSLPADDAGYLMKYRYGFQAVTDDRLLFIGERGGSDGNFGDGYSSFDHGQCVVSRSGVGNLGGDCDLPNVRDFGATYMVVQINGVTACSGSTNRSSGRISLPGANNCPETFTGKFPPFPLRALKAVGSGSIDTEHTTRATLFMGFRAKTGYVEYVGTANRAFLRFDLSALRETFSSARLRFYVQGAETDFGSAEGAISVHVIDDYGLLDEKDFDFNSLAEVNGDLLAEVSGAGYQSIDVSRAFQDAVKAGKPSLVFAFKNSVEDFDGNSRFLSIGSPLSGEPPFLELLPNSAPAVSVLSPNGAETLSDLAGPAQLSFRFSDPDFGQRHSADVFLSPTPGAKSEPLALGLPLNSSSCTDADHDPGTPNECTLAWKVPAVHLREAYLDVVVRDDAGAETLDSSDQPFLVDGLAPQNGRLKILKAGESCFTTSPLVDLALQAEDLHPVRVSFSCDNRSFSESADFAETYLAFDLSNGPGCSDVDGNRLVYARFTDSLGHFTTDFIADTLYLDRAAPAVSIRFPVDGSTVSPGSLSLAFDASDAGGLKALAYRLDAGPFEDLNLATARTLSLKEPGLHTLSVKALDNAGNFSEQAVSFVVSADASAAVASPPAVRASLDPPLDIPAPVFIPAVSLPLPLRPAPPLQEETSSDLSFDPPANCLFESEQPLGAGSSLEVTASDAQGTLLFTDSIALLSPTRFRLPERLCLHLGSGLSLSFENERERGVLQFSGNEFLGVVRVRKLAEPAVSPATAPSLPFTFLVSLTSANAAFVLLAGALLAGAGIYFSRRRIGEHPMAMNGVERSYKG